MITAEVTNNN